VRFTVAPSYLRGRLARRLLTVFVLASALPVLLVGLIAYAQFMRSARVARSERLNHAVEAVSLAFLGQVQEVSAQLSSAVPADAHVVQWMASRGLERMSFLPFATRAERAKALGAMPQTLRHALAARRDVLSWSHGRGGRSTLVLTRVQSAGTRVVRARLDVSRLLTRATALDPGAAAALIDVRDPRRMIIGGSARVPAAVIESLALARGVSNAGTVRLSEHGAWLGALWNLFLRSSFTAPAVRIALVEPAAVANGGLRELRWMIPGALLAAMAAAMLLAIRQLRRYLGPLETLTVATRRLTERNEHLEVRIDTDDELAILGHDFNRMAAELLRRAQFDGLTQLANRDFFRQILATRLATEAVGGRSTALLYIDLDAFKKINDSVGHAAGDAVLVEVVARLAACTRPGDLLARLGGDEFAVILAPGATEVEAEAEALAVRILRTLQTPFIVRGAERHVTASIGIALAPQHGNSVDVLLRNADIAMYEAKDSGRDAFARFDARMHERRGGEILLEAELQGAIERDELVLFYQPITRGARQIGVEALVRWRRGTGEMLAPGRFIPIAEQSGLIVAIGEWVLRRACADFTRWRAEGLEPGYLSVNVAPKQLLARQFLDTLCAVLAGSGIPADRLQLEITESAVAEGEQVDRALRRIGALGVHLALDDFGTGYSSLSQLHRLPIEVVKIDRSFVCELPDSLISLQLVRAIVSMAHSLDKDVVAEGVETEAQRELLEQLGCDAMQGYLMGRPVPETVLREMLLAAASPAPIDAETVGWPG
jgi:diguanylate cyclase (GGDEF)-like protein